SHFRQMNFGMWVVCLGACVCLCVCLPIHVKVCMHRPVCVVLMCVCVCVFVCVCVCLRVHMQFNAKVWAPLSKIRILLIYEVKTSKYNPCRKPLKIRTFF